MASKTSTDTVHSMNAAATKLPTPLNINNSTHKLVRSTRNDDIVFIDMDATKRPASSSSSGRVSIDPTLILRECNESSPDAVYEIILHGHKLTKIQHLDSFKKCRSLDLSSNHIERLENLKYLKDLRELKVYDNRITEISNLDCLTELNFLQLQHNQIVTIGTGLCKLKKLVQLRLDDNQISEINVKQLSSCSGLTCLDLSHNQLHDITPLNCLPNLEELRLACNKIKQVSDLQRCRKLQQIDLSGNKIVDVSGLKGLPALTILDLSKNLLASLLSTGPLKKLKDLNISDNKFRDVSKLVKLFPGVEILKISNNRFEDVGEFRWLSGCEELVELYMDGNPLYGDHDNRSAVNQEVTAMLPGLEILNGAHTHRRGTGTGTGTGAGSAPVMRPMSANTIISVRQVEHQIRAMETELSAFEADVSKKFEAMSSSICSLPDQPPGGATVTESPRPGTSSRPGTGARQSRCGSKSKLRDAMQFASSHFDDV